MPTPTEPQVRRSGLANRPSMTNRPIWQIQAMPSEKDLVVCW